MVGWMDGWLDGWMVGPVCKFGSVPEQATQERDEGTRGGHENYLLRGGGEAFSWNQVDLLRKSENFAVYWGHTLEYSYIILVGICTDRLVSHKVSTYDAK